MADDLVAMIKDAVPCDCEDSCRHDVALDAVLRFGGWPKVAHAMAAEITRLRAELEESEAAEEGTMMVLAQTKAELAAMTRERDEARREAEIHKANADRHYHDLMQKNDEAFNAGIGAAKCAIIDIGPHGGRRCPNAFDEGPSAAFDAVEAIRKEPQT